MPSSSETNEPSRLCHIHIVAAGLPHRGEIILERERNLFSMMADRLMGRGKRHSEEGVRSVPMQALENAFSERKARTLPSAAFVAGRCQPCAPEDQERLTAVIRDLLDSLPAETPGIMSRAYIEASMSLALRGDTDRARQALAALIANAPDSSVSYLAAFYLAQLGDPSGFPAMKNALRSTNEHTRLMALRHLIAFEPYDSQTIQDNAVNIRAELTQRLVDHDPYVRVEVPYYMAEACVEDLKDLLEPVAQNDRNKDVREAARSILERVVQ